MRTEKFNKYLFFPFFTIHSSLSTVLLPTERWDRLMGFVAWRGGFAVGLRVKRVRVEI
jgi:hypothetical protein